MEISSPLASPTHSSRRWRRTLALLITVSVGVTCLLTSQLSVAPASASTQTIQDGFNADVLSTVTTDGIQYVAGGFSAWGPQTGGGTLVDATTGAFDRSFADFDGEVTASVSDGAGGLYVGGYFTSVGSHGTAGIAHLHADGSVDTGFRVFLNGGARAFTVRNSVLYAGGGFTCVGAEQIPADTCQEAGDVERYSLAAFTSTGELLPWNPQGNPDLGYDVTSMALANSTLYVGGYFTQFGPSGATMARNGLAAFDLASGTPDVPTTWNPDPNNAALALELAGNTLYVGGAFTQLATSSTPVTRNRLAAFNLASGTPDVPTTWNPDPNNAALALELAGNTLYVGGTFTQLATSSTPVTRNRLAAFNLASGTPDVPTSWNPNADGDVSDLLVEGSTVYALGSFAHVQGLPRARAAAVSTAPSTAVLDWNPNLDDVGMTAQMLDGRVFVGGQFRTVNDWVPRSHLASLTTSGTLTSWAPAVNAGVSQLLIAGDRLYALGQFSQISGVTRKGLAAFALPSGTLTSWDPGAVRIYYSQSVDVTMESFAAAGGLIYVAGDFTSIAGQVRPGLAALDAQTGTASAWAPGEPMDANGDRSYVFDLTVSGDVVYVAGAFASIGPDARALVAALDSTTGATSAWNPRVDGINVTAITVVGSTAVFGGRVTCMGQGVPGSSCTGPGETSLQGLAGADVVTGEPVAGWLHQLSFDETNLGYPRDFTTHEGITYLAGEFGLLDGHSVGNLAAFTSSGAVIPDWQPQANGGVESIELTGSVLTVGGAFTRLNGLAPRYLQTVGTYVRPAPSPSGGGGSQPSAEASASTQPSTLPSSAPSPTASPSAQSPTPSTTRRPLGGGVTAISGPEASRAKVIKACGAPGRSIATAPETSAKANSIVKLTTAGVPRSTSLRARMRIDGTWAFLGRVTSSKRGTVTLPAFTARRTNTYPIELTTASGDKLFTTVLIGASKSTGCARQR